jgi:GNAT superfamily N-acetyltransferase
VGFGRAVTDYARFAWISDIYIEEAHKGQGLGKWLMTCILADPRLATVNRWMLATDDAHGLYRQHGFEPLEAAEAAKVMQRRRPLA